MSEHELMPLVERLLKCCRNARGLYFAVEGTPLQRELPGFDRCHADLLKVLDEADDIVFNYKAENLMFIHSDTEGSRK